MPKNYTVAKAKWFWTNHSPERRRPSHKEELRCLKLGGSRGSWTCLAISVIFMFLRPCHSWYVACITDKGRQCDTSSLISLPSPFIAYAFRRGGLPRECGFVGSWRWRTLWWPLIRMNIVHTCSWFHVFYVHWLWRLTHRFPSPHGLMMWKTRSCSSWSHSLKASVLLRMFAESSSSHNPQFDSLLSHQFLSLNFNISTHTCHASCCGFISCML